MHAHARGAPHARENAVRRWGDREGRKWLRRSCACGPSVAMEARRRVAGRCCLLLLCPLCGCAIGRLSNPIVRDPGFEDAPWGRGGSETATADRRHARSERFSRPARNGRTLVPAGGVDGMDLRARRPTHALDSRIREQARGSASGGDQAGSTDRRWARGPFTRVHHKVGGDVDDSHRIDSWSWAGGGRQG